MNVAHLRCRGIRMTDQDYDIARSELGERKDTKARWDQQLAALFIRSGWTQEQLAKKEGKSQQHIARCLRFGHFLSFTPMGVNIETHPKNLTERKFREYWERTSGTNERQRFAEVQRLMAEDLQLIKEKHPRITTAAIEEFGDGKWHAIESIASRFAITNEQADAAMRRSTKVKMERKKVGKSFHFRLFPKTRMVSSDELTTKLVPIVDGLTAEGKKNTTTMSPPTVADLAGQLRKLLDEWSK